MANRSTDPSPPYLLYRFLLTIGALITLAAAGLRIMQHGLDLIAMILLGILFALFACATYFMRDVHDLDDEPEMKPPQNRDDEKE